MSILEAWLIQIKYMYILYCKHSKLIGPPADFTYHIYSTINNIYNNQALGAQRFRVMWTIVVKSDETRSSLLHVSHVLISNMKFALYPDNPYVWDIREQVIGC